MTDHLAHWDFLLSHGADDRERGELQKRLASGRLRRLPNSSQDLCQEVDALPHEGRRACEALAVVFDTERGRRQCVVHASTNAFYASSGLPEPPVVEPETLEG